MWEKSYSWSYPAVDLACYNADLTTQDVPTGTKVACSTGKKHTWYNELGQWSMVGEVTDPGGSFLQLLFH